MQTLTNPAFSVVPIRKLLRNWKEISEQVNKDEKPAVVFSHNEPQVAIIPIKMFNKLDAYYEDLRKFAEESETENSEK